jgi:hypothetical protein
MLSTRKVGLAVHWIKVAGVAAGPHATQVVKVQPFGDLPHEQGVGQPVDEPTLLIQPDLAIAVLVLAPLPDPASCLVNDDALGDALLSSQVEWHSQSPLRWRAIAAFPHIIAVSRLVMARAFSRPSGSNPSHSSASSHAPALIPSWRALTESSLGG